MRESVMRTFFTYTYSAHEANHYLLKEIYGIALEFHHVAQNIPQPLDSTYINNLVIRYENLFLQLNYKFVKSINSLIFPYIEVSRLAEVLSFTAALIKNPTLTLTTQEYINIIKEMSITVPYVYDLLIKHESVIAAIPNSMPFHKEAVRQYENKRLKNLDNIIKNNPDANKKQDAQKERAALMAKMQQKYTYPPLPAGMQAPAQGTATKLIFPKIDRILIKYSDPWYLQQFSKIKEFIDSRGKRNPLSRADVFIFCKTLAFVSEAIFKHHLSNKIFDNPNMLVINQQIYNLRNQLVHGLDYESAAEALESIISTEISEYYKIRDLLREYITLIEKMDVESKPNMPVYNLFVERNRQQDKVGQILKINIPVLSTKFKLTRIQGDILGQQQKLNDFIYHIHAIKVLLFNFRYFCGQHSLDASAVRKLFITSTSTVYQRGYHELNNLELEKRLVLEGILEALGEVTGILMGKENTVSLLEELGEKDLNLNATPHEEIEDFLIVLTDYRNTSTHLLRYTDIPKIAKMILSTTVDYDQQLQNLATEVEDICQAKWGIKTTTKIESPAFRDRCNVM